MKKIAKTTGGIIALGGILVAALFLMNGGRVNFVETPSMATYAPVGSLVISSPTNLAELRVGDPILFTPPGGTKSYFHRVHALTSEGAETIGDLNGSVDPWVITDAELLGEEIFHAPALGFLLKAAPILILGGMLVHFVTGTWVTRYWRTPIRVAGWTALVSGLLTSLVPLVDAAVISQTVVEGEATTVFVPTGLWPVDAEAFGGTKVYGVQPGELVSVVSSRPNSADQFSVELGAHMEAWAWFFLVILWFVPAGVTAGYYLYARKLGLDIIETDDEPASEEKPKSGRRRAVARESR